MVEKKPAQPTPNFPKGGTTFTESAYKEFEGKDLHIVTPESPEPQEKIIGFSSNNVDADLYKKHIEGIEGYWGDAVYGREKDDTETKIMGRKAFEKALIDYHKINSQTLRQRLEAQGSEIFNLQCYIAELQSKLAEPVSAPSESQEELSYDKIRSEYLNHRGRIWTKEEVMLKWIIENYKLITRNP